MTAGTSLSGVQGEAGFGWRHILVYTLLTSLALLAGIALVWFELLSEERVWAVPGVVLVAGGLFALLFWWRERRLLRTTSAPVDGVADKSGAVAAASDADDTETSSGGLSAIRFHQMVAEAFRRQGYRVITRKGGPDLSASADLILEKNGRSYFVQCGLWKTPRVGVTAVRKLHGHVQAAGVQGGYVVTTGVFTQEALTLARETGIEAIDGTRLRSLMRGVKG